MKLVLTCLGVIFSISFSNSQHNFFVNAPEAQATYIRDAVLLKNKSLLCALDLDQKEKHETGIVLLNEEGKAEWSKKINISESQEVFGYDVIAHNNGYFYLHGLVTIAYQQYAFILKIDKNGELRNKSFFNLESSVFQAINKMKVTKDGDLIFSFLSGTDVNFVRMDPELRIKWGTSIDRTIKGTGKQPGYDFQILADQSIVACGKNDFHFGIIKISSKGDVLMDQDINMGTYSQAKTIQVLPDGDFIVTGDYLPANNFTSFIMRVNGQEGTPIWAKELDQFDGSFHYQQTELVGDEIHLSLMGNNNPLKMDPDFQNYYVKMNFDGEVQAAYRNGDRYDLADYQRLIRLDNQSIIYGSAYNDQRQVSGLVHSYQSQDFDMCYWSELDITTSPVSQNATISFSAYPIEELRTFKTLDITLSDLRLSTEGTCKQVWNESSQKEEENAARTEVAQQNAIVETQEFVVFPNPNDGVFSIRTTYDYVQATILDASGKVILQDQLENNEVIDLSVHPKGVYIMQIVTETETFIRRIQIR